MARLRARRPGRGRPGDRAIAEGVQAVVGLRDATEWTSCATGIKRARRARATRLDDTQRPLVAIGKVVLWLFAGDAERADAAQAAALEHPDPWVRAAIRSARAARRTRVLSTTMARPPGRGAGGLRGARRQLGAGDGALPGVRPAGAGGRAGGGGDALEQARVAMEAFSPETRRR